MTKERRQTQVYIHGEDMRPFRINYTLIHYCDPKLAGKFYKVRIGNIVSLEHKWMMNVSSCRIAYKSSKRNSKINSNMLSTIVEHLKVSPSLPAHKLRPLLQNLLPAHTDINTKIIDNFRRGVFLHMINNLNSNQISSEESKTITSGRTIRMSEANYLIPWQLLISTSFIRKSWNRMHQIGV